MNEKRAKTFLTGVLLRRTVLRVFLAEGTKLSLWLLAFIGTFVALRYFRRGVWLRADSWEVIGSAVGLVAAWSVSAVRTVSAAYRDFNAKR